MIEILPIFCLQLQKNALLTLCSDTILQDVVSLQIWSAESSFHSFGIYYVISIIFREFIEFFSNFTV